MSNSVVEHIESALTQFSGDDFYKELLRAKSEFSKLTGPIDEDEDDYESRMDSFNIWYLFDFKLDGKRTVIEKYIEENSIPHDIEIALLSRNFSVFEFAGESTFRKQMILKDILHDRKVVLPKGHFRPGLVEGDIFIGSTVDLEEESHLLPVFCLLPKEALSPIKKKSKLIRKAGGEKTEEFSFLMNTELLRNRYRRYRHVSAKKFFQYE